MDLTVQPRRACGTAANLLFVLFVVIVTSLSDVISTDVATTDGKLVGFKQYVDGYKHTVDTFLGVPYARPPVGELRFKPPQPGMSWVGERSAKYLPDSCLQIDYFYMAEKLSDKSTANNNNSWAISPFSDPLLSPPTQVSEDCLYLNMWVPRTDENRTLPALVWLHGGTFATGSASSPFTDGAYLAAVHEVIVISVNYRLGVSGFFYTGNGSSHQDNVGSPGNLGLMDQKLALKWIYNNVVNFRGSRRHITLFGTDAGAVSAGIHLLSPRSWPYFSRAALQSGSPLSEHWALAQPEVMRKRSLELAALAGCDAGSGDEEGTKRMMKCMRDLSQEKLLTAQQQFGKRHRDLVNGFVPVLDGDMLPDDPASLLKAGKAKPAPLLIGVNKNDGLQTLLWRLPRQFPAHSTATVRNITREVFTDDVIPTFLPTAAASATPQQLDTLERLYADREVRAGNSSPISFFNASESLVSDAVFRCDVINFARFFYVRSDVYLYSFEHESPNEVVPGWLGARHYAEVAMLFGRPFRRSVGFSRNEMVLSRKMMDLWTNFAKFGSPNFPRSTPVWPRFATGTLRHLVLNAGRGMTTRTRLRHKECSFLSKILPSMQGDVTDPDSYHPDPLPTAEADTNADSTDDSQPDEGGPSTGADFSSGAAPLYLDAQLGSAAGFAGVLLRLLLQQLLVVGSLF